MTPMPMRMRIRNARRLALVCAWVHGPVCSVVGQHRRELGGERRRACVAAVHFPQHDGPVRPARADDVAIAEQEGNVACSRKTFADDEKEM